MPGRSCTGNPGFDDLPARTGENPRRHDRRTGWPSSSNGRGHGDRHRAVARVARQGRPVRWWRKARVTPCRGAAPSWPVPAAASACRGRSQESCLARGGRPGSGAPPRRRGPQPVVRAGQEVTVILRRSREAWRALKSGPPRPRLLLCRTGCSAGGGSTAIEKAMRPRKYTPTSTPVVHACPVAGQGSTSGLELSGYRYASEQEQPLMQTNPGSTLKDCARGL